MLGAARFVEDLIFKHKVMPQGVNRRYVVTNIQDTPQRVYHGFYVQRGDVPERPIGELKNGLAIDRLSSHRFLANAFTMQCHLLAYALVVLFREANEALPEVATEPPRCFSISMKSDVAVFRILFDFTAPALRMLPPNSST